MRYEKQPIHSTLDATHNERLQYFEALKESLPGKIQLLKEKREKLSQVESIIESRELLESISNLECEIKDIEDRKEENEYYLKAGKILFQYYENLDKNEKGTLDLNAIDREIINPFSKETKKELYKSPNKKQTVLDTFLSKKDTFQRGTIYEEYLATIDPSYTKTHEGESIDSSEEYYCFQCDEYRLIDQAESSMICPKCASSIPIFIDHEKQSFKDVPLEINCFAYKRINHFNECLAQFQAKESTNIPQEVYDTILIEMKKEKNTNLANLTNKKIRGYLKKHSDKKFNKYYEHIPHIINNLNGIPPKTMSPKMEEILRARFKQIQIPFEKHKPKDRKNLLKTDYIMYKFCQLEGWDEFLPLFNLLKSKDKLYGQDCIWKAICKTLNWPFIPSR
jgi:hypothetical protein